MRYTAEPEEKGTVFLNPVNGHYYQLVEIPSGINWYAARDATAASTYHDIPGHLATVTSAQEDDFLIRTFPEIYPAYVWLGANDETNEGEWRWLTGEPWQYTK